MKASALAGSDSVFAAFTDADTMRTLLGGAVRALWDDAHRIVECEVAHAWRKTYGKAASWHKSHLKVCYRLHLVRSEESVAFPVWVHGTARLGEFPGDDKAAAAISHGVATLRLHRFPEDAGLPQLPTLVDPERARERTESLFGAAIGPVSVTVLRYRPGDRCSFRVGEEAVGRPALACAFAKTYADDAGALVFQRLRTLFREGRASGNVFPVAEPLAYDAATRTVWQRWIDGGTVAELTRSEGFAERVQQCARALAGLHAVQVDGLPACARAVLLHDTRKRAAKLALAYPQATGSLERTLDALSQSMDALPLEAPVTIHGDVHLEQFLVQAEGVAVADIDEMARGDAEQDLASLLVDLRLRAADCGPGEPWSDVAAEAYGRQAMTPVSRSLLAWHVARHGIDKAYRLHWRDRPEFTPTVIHLIAWAAESARSLTEDLS